jgi:hypothetical protein
MFVCVLIVKIAKTGCLSKDRFRKTPKIILRKRNEISTKNYDRVIKIFPARF